MNYSYPELVGLLDCLTYRQLGKFPHQYKYYFKSDNNEALFSFLENEGFFQFHISNKQKEVISEHQIIAFFCCGGQQALANGFQCRKDETEIHHINGKTWDNHPSNLIYVPSETHAQVTKHQKAVKKYLKLFKKGKVTIASIWNRKGKAVRDFNNWLLNLIVITVIKTAKAYGVEIFLKSLTLWMRKLLKRIRAGIDTTYVPSLILQEIQL